MAEYNFYAFSETWLKPGVLNNEIFNNNFFIIRCDRLEEFKRSGGGVLIACRSTLNVVPLKFDDIRQLFSQVEIVGLLFISLGIKIHLVNIYIPPACRCISTLSSLNYYRLTLLWMLKHWYCWETSIHRNLLILLSEAGM